jgi:hypothetical protein
MKSINHTTKAVALSVAFAGLLTGMAGNAAAADTGSTDIYRNEFRTAFGPATQAASPSTQSKVWIGSTDIYANQFPRSFGEPAQDPVAGSHARASVGSTDTWGSNGFQRSFESTAS